MKRVAVLGAGAWGTVLANLLAESGRDVRLWTVDAEHAHMLARDRENIPFFPGVRLHAALEVTSDIARAVSGAEAVLIVVPSHAVRQTLKGAAPNLADDAALISFSKGIEEQSLMLMSEVVCDVLGEGADSRMAVVSGPSFAREVASGVPTNVVAASRNPELAGAVQSTLSTERLRVYTSDDPVGVEVGGALKNVIAIAAGAADGLGFGQNTRAALITRGLREISRLAVAMGGNPITLAGLAGLGDLILTCTGDLSRNRRVGYQMAKGKRLDDVLAELGAVAEGVRTAKSGYELAQRLNVDLPISTEVYRVLYEHKSPESAVVDLLSRPVKRELD